MINSTDQSSLRQWISRSVFLEEAARVELLEKLETMPEKNIKRLFLAFKNADQQQHELLIKTLQTQPGLWTDVQQSVRLEQKNTLVRKESSSVEAEQEVLSSLEEELSNLSSTKE